FKPCFPCHVHQNLSILTGSFKDPALSQRLCRLVPSQFRQKNKGLAHRLANLELLIFDFDSRPDLGFPHVASLHWILF
ncbi:hypothetical protein K443DRAFT_97207, partial [Laccaria amethystina LaAM-08-1]